MAGLTHDDLLRRIDKLTELSAQLCVSEHAWLNVIAPVARDERAAYRRLLKTAAKALEDAALVLKRARATSLEVQETTRQALRRAAASANP